MDFDYRINRTIDELRRMEELQLVYILGNII